MSGYFFLPFFIGFMYFPLNIVDLKFDGIVMHGAYILRFGHMEATALGLRHCIAPIFIDVYF